MKKLLSASIAALFIGVILVSQGCGVDQGSRKSSDGHSGHAH